MAKKKFLFYPSVRTSWLLLTSFFVFDNFVSYWAVVYKNGKEANFLIASLVEKYPLLYFLCIPAEVIMIYIILVIVRSVFLRFFSRFGFRSNDVTRVVLASVVVYWPLGVSPPNLFFLLGHRMSLHTIGTLLVLGFVVGLVYGVIMLCKIRLNNLQ